MTRHVDNPELARIVRGFCTSKEAGEAVLHLAVCGGCHRRLLHRHPEEGRQFLESWLTEFACTKGLAVEEVASNLPEFFSALGDEETRTVRKAPTLLRTIRGLSEAHQHLYVANSPRFHTLAFLESSLAEARDHWHSSPVEAVRWASAAVTVAERAEPSLNQAYARTVWADVKARAWAYLANGYRIGGDLHAADGALATSRRFLEKGTGTLEVRAEVRSLEGSLRRGQRRFDDSWSAAFEAERIYQTIGIEEAAASAVLVGSSALAEAGKIERAIRKLQRSLSRLPKHALGGRTHFGLLQNLAWRLTEADRPEQAARLLPEVRQLSAQLVAEPLTHARIQWLEARIHGLLGQPRLAEAAFRDLKRVFLDARSPYDAALASLDLAVHLIEDGRSGEGAELARDLVPIFRSRGIHREALAAGMLVARSLSEETASVDFVQRVATYLRHARLDPTYRFPG